jgi:hypothetical protein
VTPRAWCRLTVAAVFCAVAIPAVMGAVLLLALIPGCNSPWIIGVANGALIAGSGWLLVWVLGGVGARWDRL